MILLDITNLEINTIKESGFLIFYIPLEIILANDFQMHGTLRIPWKPYRTLGGASSKQCQRKSVTVNGLPKIFFFFFWKEEKYLFSLKKYFFVSTHFFNSLFCGGGGGLCYGAQASLAVTGRVSCH